MRAVIALLLGVVSLLLAAPSRAGEIEIAAVDGTAWSQLVQQMQDDTKAQGRLYRIRVLDGTPVPCGQYELKLDAVSAAAFIVEGCDASTHATKLRLAHREALFEPGDVVPRARTASISAAITRQAHAQGGGAPPQAGSKLWCTVALQPYLWDGLRGEPMPLMPDRFELRPLDANIHAAPDGAGWIARGESRFALRFGYEVIDLQTGKKVLDNEATLACADAPAAQQTQLTDVPRDLMGNPLQQPPTMVAGPPWWVAVDVPTPPTIVASMLLRPVRDIVLPDGTRASTLYGQGPMILGGTTFGVSYQRGLLFVPARLTLAGDATTFAVSAFGGVGIALNPRPDLSMYVAPALRFTALEVGGHGFWNQLDGALLAGLRRRFWGSPHCRGHGGFEGFVEAAAPGGGTGVWLMSAGISSSWGPGGGYYFTGCPQSRSSKGRR